MKKILEKLRMTIYLDIVFFENIVINFLIILATAIISKSKINPPKILLASSIRWDIFNTYIFNQINKFSKFNLKNSHFNTHCKNILSIKKNKISCKKPNTFLSSITNIWWYCIYAFIFYKSRKYHIKRWNFTWNISFKSYFNWSCFRFNFNSD